MDGIAGEQPTRESFARRTPISITLGVTMIRSIKATTDSFL
jgi:hypothetical protein